MLPAMILGDDHSNATRQGKADRKATQTSRLLQAAEATPVSRVTALYCENAIPKSKKAGPARAGETLPTDSSSHSSDGFTANSRVTLQFAKRYYYIGSTATATIILQAGSGVELEDGEPTPGTVTITGPGIAPPISVDTYGASGISVNIPLPTTPGEYTYTASYSIHSHDDPHTHRDDSTAATVIVYQVTDVAVSGEFLLASESPETWVARISNIGDSNTVDDNVLLTAVTYPDLSGVDVSEISMMGVTWQGGSEFPGNQLRRMVSRGVTGIFDVTLLRPLENSIGVKVVVIGITDIQSLSSDLPINTVEGSLQALTSADNQSPTVTVQVTISPAAYDISTIANYVIEWTGRGTKSK